MTTSHRRTRLLFVLFILIPGVVLPLGVQAQDDPRVTSPTAAADSLHAVADDYFAAWLARNPVQATILGFHEFSAHVPRPFDVAARNQYRRTLETLYHLIFGDWTASIARQAAVLDDLIRQTWGDGATSVLDVACGIGTQAIGLAQRGYDVTASDLSPQMVARSTREADLRGLAIDVSVTDIRQADTHHPRTFDVVMACDNAVPHLLSDDDILDAFRAFYRCVEPGGGCIITVRDYDGEGDPNAASSFECAAPN